MAHDRILVLSLISLTKARPNRHGIDVGMELMEQLEKVMISSDFFLSAPFNWIGLSLRYGLKNEEEPHYLGIDKKDGELAMAIELDTHELIDASREELKDLFMVATLKSLIHAGRKYERPVEDLEDLLKEQNIVKF